MIISINTVHGKGKYMLFLLLALTTFQARAQKHISNIPNNGKIVSVRDWLVTNPMPGEYLMANTPTPGYPSDFLAAIGGEKSPKIVADQPFSTPDGKANRFKLHSWEGNYIDLTVPFGRPINFFTYLYAELYSEVSQLVYLHIGTNDAGKVWVNGELIIDHPTGRSAQPSQDIAKIELKSGTNHLLLKINQEGGGWGAYAQVYGVDDQKLFDGKLAMLQASSDEIATIIETKVICKQTDRYIGWPSIAKMQSGELAAVFSGNRDEHVCPYGITQLIRSTDNGKTWSHPATVNNTPLDDRDAGILETASGTWLVSWFTSMAFDSETSYIQHPDWKRHRDKLNAETIDHWLGNWTRRSLDQGKTWQEPVKQLVTAPHGPIELNDGRLLYMGNATINGEKCLAVEESKNEGQSWKLLATIEIPEDEEMISYNEPHVVELPDGKLLAMFRYEKGERKNSFMRQSESMDGGLTWSVTRKTNVWGYPPHILLLENGWLLLSYGVRQTPYGERACISKDGGLTWDVEHEILLEMSKTDDLGYPASIQLDNGSILTIYYQIDQEGEKTSLMQTHWKLKDYSSK